MLLAVCNPFYTLRGDTMLQRRHCPLGARYSAPFSWTKTLAGGVCRSDWHSPLDALLNQCKRAGFHVKW